MSPPYHPCRASTVQPTCAPRRCLPPWAHPTVGVAAGSKGYPWTRGGPPSRGLPRRSPSSGYALGCDEIMFKCSVSCLLPLAGGYRSRTEVMHARPSRAQLGTVIHRRASRRRRRRSDLVRFVRIAIVGGNIAVVLLGHCMLATGYGNTLHFGRAIALSIPRIQHAGI